MDILKIYFLSLLLLSSSIKAARSNDSSIEEHRVPRVSGRIVKIYSGNRPEPYLCISEGYKADPYSCASFYRCVKERNGKFSVFRYQCAPGTVYDPDLETCNHARNTRRTECGGVVKPIVQTMEVNEIEEPSPKELPRPINTNGLGFTTKLTTASQWVASSPNISRPTTFYQSPSTSAPYPIDNTKHNFGYLSTVSTNTPLSYTTKREQDLPKITTLPKLETYSDICSFDGFTGDEQNCRKFYRCVGNQRGGFLRYEFFCSESTVWDEGIQSCNHPWAVKRSKCGRSMSFTEKSEMTKPPRVIEKAKEILSKAEIQQKNNNNIQEQLQISQNAQVTQTQTQISHGNQVIQNQTQINYGDRLDQNKKSVTKQNQTQISHGSAVSQSQTQIDYGDKGVQLQLQIDHSTNSSQYQTQVYESTTSTTTSQQHSNQHNNRCYESGFIGDANDCKKFYRCVDSGRGTFTKYEYKCGDGTVWDQSIDACNHAWAVKECGGQSHTESEGSTHTEPQSSSTMKSTSYYTETTKSTQNYNTTENPDIDDIDVGYGNQGQSETTTLSSTTKSTSTSENPKQDTTECSSNGFMGDTNDCKKFYRCVDSGRGTFTKHEFKCGEGTVWDPDIEACNHAWAVQNCGGTSISNDKVETTTTRDNDTVKTTVTLVQTTTQSSTSIDDYDSGYGSQSAEPTFMPIKTTREPLFEITEESQNDNACKSSGFMGNANNCKKFYRCVDDSTGGYTRYEFTCGEGTVWDSSIEACNHAWAVKKCGGSGETSESTQTSQQTSTASSKTTRTTPIDKNTNEPIQTSTISSTSTFANLESNENDICRNSGFVGDSKDCKKFYRCVDNGDGTYTLYDFICGEGTVWDSEIEACNHNWAVKRCGGNGNGESTEPAFTSSFQYPTMQDEDKENEPTTQSHVSSSAPHSTTTTKANEMSTANENCNGSGFVGDKNDCKKFYRCVNNENGDYDRYEFYCGDGTVWDNSISACNHAWAVKGCGSSTQNTPQSNNEYTSESSFTSVVTENQETTQHSTEKSTSTTGNVSENEVPDGNCKEEGFFESNSDCKKFYRCVADGKGGFTKYDFTCGEGTTWNQKIQACDHPSSDRPCGQGPSTEETHIYDEMVTEPPTKVTSTTATSDTEETQETQKPQSSSGLCKSEGFYGDLSDCKKFYRCVDNGKGGYTKYDFTCGDGTVWSGDIQACDHESDDKQCLSSTPASSVSSSSTEANGSQLESTTSVSSTTTNNQVIDKTESPPSSSDKCTSDGFFAHPNDCKKFVRCVSNGNGEYTRYEFDCGEGTVWVQEIQACDHDNEIINCSKKNEQSTKPQDHTQESFSTIESGSSSSTESQTPYREDDEYPTTKQPSSTNDDQCTSEGYYANKNDCRKFYRCVDNGNDGYTKYDFVCGEGTAWDSNIGNCNHINEVASCSETDKEDSHTQQTMKDEEISQTTADTSTTSSSSESSTSSSTSTTIKSTEEYGSTDRCESEGYYGDSKDCKKFYRCVDDGNGGLTKYDFTCADGTIWDQDITNCNHPEDVTNPSCKPGEGGDGGDIQTSSPSSNTSSTTKSPELNTESNTSESSTGSPSNCSQEDSSKKPASGKDISCEEAGYYANPNDCKKFYRCVDWDGDGKRFSVYHFECGEGTIWDPALDTCNHEESVYPPRDCSQTQSQTESSSSEGTTTKKQEETTTEQTTTQESMTSEQTTTQESATSEQTTTQQTSTSEQTTTQQSITSEQTTTQQSTTSEQTTTQQSTTSPQTTKQESTTSEQTTTQESTTSEQTTTQESTTSKQTTTKASTTSEQTTTQESTTSEQTTTQASITSEQTTTQESTTSEQTTTQASTTSEQTTTQESTTSEQSTTQESQTTQQTTEQTSEHTEESSTTEGTTESYTTESDGSTTEQSSTTTESEKESTTSSSSEKECPETEDDQNLYVCPTSFKRDPKYCNMFYQCTDDEDTHEKKLAFFKCPNETIYDESKNQCVEEKKADKKCNGEMARRHRLKRLHRDSKEPITLENEMQLSCPAVGYYPFENNIECSNGFLKCARSKSGRIRGYVHQCPEGYLFWTISKRCELNENIRDCKRSSNDWKGRWNIPVDRKNVAF